MGYLKKFLLIFFISTSIMSFYTIYGFAADTTNNIGFVKAMSYAALKEDGTLWKIPFFDYGSKYTKIGENYVDFYSHYMFTLGVKKDGSLWVFDIDANVQSESDSSKSNAPTKIMDNVQSVSGLVVLKKDDSVWTWDFDVNSVSKEQLIENKPKMIYKGAKSFGVCDVYINVIDSKGTLFSIANNTNYYGKKPQNKITKISDNVIFTSGHYFIKRDKTLWSIDLSNNSEILGSSLVLKNVKYADEGCAIKEDGTLFSLYINDLPMTQISTYPQKLISNVKYANNDSSHILAVKNDGSICQMGSIPPVSNYSLPRPALKNVMKFKTNWFKTASPCIWALTNNNTLWKLCFEKGNCTRTKEADNIKDIFDNGVIEKTDGSKWIYRSVDSVSYELVRFNGEITSDKNNSYSDSGDNVNENSDYYIKNDELWVRDILQSGDNSNTNTNNFIKVMDNVVSAQYYSYINSGIAICKDKSLWTFSLSHETTQNNGSDGTKIKMIKLLENASKINGYCSATLEDGSLYIWGKNSETKPIDTDLENDANKPQKIFDDVTWARPGTNYVKGAVLLNNGCLYAWGSNSYGNIGLGPVNSVDKPQKILDDVTWAQLGDTDGFALQKDGTLLFWGCSNPNYSGDQSELINFMNVGAFNDDNRIEHFNYESVGINEDIDATFKIKDSSSIKDAKIILSNKKEISLDKRAGDYYTALIPGMDKSGVISYHITADDNGQILQSMEYKVEVISKDQIIIDSSNDELVLSNAKISVLGNLLSLDTPLALKNGRLLVPVRALCEAIGCNVSWDDKTKTASIIKGDNKIMAKIGDKTIKTKSNDIKIDVAAVLVKGRTLLPLRAISEALGVSIDWDGANNLAEISR
ncbi:MAG: stalk domain-containing protein [Bacillota bacterium]|nr:stalk domain-containing protein [Bacillota bacterium]